MKSSYTNTAKCKSCLKKISPSRKIAIRSAHKKCIKKLKLNVPLLKRRRSKRRSRRSKTYNRSGKSKRKSKSRTDDGSGKGKREESEGDISEKETKKSKRIKKCKKWERIPDYEMSNYDVSIRRCKSCENITSFPYIVHSTGKEEESLDYDCYKCGEDVDVRYMCAYCIKDK
jgi:hypothetical protein